MWRWCELAAAIERAVAAQAPPEQAEQQQPRQHETNTQRSLQASAARTRPFRAFTFAPWARRNRTRSVCPYSEAMWSGPSRY